MIKPILLISMIQFFCSSLIASDYLLTKLTLEDGLSENTPYCVYQDYQGFLWVGTEDGLNRYDGSRFKLYKKERNNFNSLNNNWIISIIEDNAQRLWVGTTEGLCYYQRKTDNFQRIHALKNYSVEALWCDSEGNIWIGTNEQGLYILRDDSLLTPVHLKKHDSQTLTINNIIGGETNNLWISTDQGVFEYSPTTKTIEHYLENLTDPVRFVIPIADQTIWVGTLGDGLYHIDPQSELITHYTTGKDSPVRLPTNYYRSWCRDSSGTIWLGTYNYGIFQFDPEEKTLKPINNRILTIDDYSNTTILSLYSDRTELLWAGVSAKGLAKIYKPKFNFLHHAPQDTQSLSSPVIWSIVQDRANKLWIGAQNGGLNCYDLQTGRYLYFTNNPSNPNSLIHDNVWSLSIDSSDNLWIGTTQGLSRLNKDRTQFSSFTYDPRNSNSLINDRTWITLCDRQQRIWVGTNGGLCYYHPDQKKFFDLNSHFKQSQEIQSNLIRSLFQDSHRNIWVGTMDKGAYLINESLTDIRHFTVTEQDTFGIFSNSIYCFCEDANQQIWIGTGEGVVCYNLPENRFQIFSGSEKIPQSIIYGILADKKARIWFSSNYGLFCLDPGTGTIDHYTSGDGLQSNEFNVNAYFANTQGEFFFGGINGLNYFHPDSLKLNLLPPPIVITAFKVFNQDFPLPNAIHTTRQIELDYTHQVFSFEVAALDFVAPLRNRFQYKLEGFDTEWQTLDNRNYIQFTNIEPGNYKFHVKASNSDGIWNEDGISVDLVIHPPFWKTFYFRFLTLFIGILSLYTFYKRRINLVEKRKVELEKLVKIRTLEIQEKSHQLDLKNSELEMKNHIMEQINQMVKLLNSEIEFNHVLNSILESTRTILNSDMAIILIFNKAEQIYQIASTINIIQQENIELSFSQAEELFSRNCQPLLQDIFLQKSPDIEVFQQYLPHFPKLSAFISLRLRVNNKIEGYLVQIYRDPKKEIDNFLQNRLSLLINLNEHILTAFIKSQMLDELKKLNEKKNAFLGMAAHDLRNPLSVINGYIGLISHYMKQEQFNQIMAQPYIDKIQSNVVRMSKLINDLLDISSIESGKVVLNRTHCDYATLTLEVTLFYNEIAHQKNIKLTYIPPLEAIELNIDPHRITEVLENLISNALKYTHAFGIVEISIERKNKSILTYIKDSGVGLNPADLKEVFTTFKKLSAKPTGGESSTGLGLAIVKKIVELHGGQVGVTSTLGEGSTFYFSLPEDSTPK